MEEENVAPEQAPKPDACISCGNPQYEAGYANNLCTDCRDKYARFPIPNWIKLFAAGILVLVVIGLARVYTPAMAAIHLARGIRAVKAQKYTTAYRELDKALVVFPESMEANAYAVIADYYSMRLPEMVLAFNSVKGKECEDQELFSKVNDVIERTNNLLLPNDTMQLQIIEEIPLDSVAEFDHFVAVSTEHDSMDLALRYRFADRFYDMKEYGRSEQMLTPILAQYPDFLPGLGLMVAIKRDQGKYDEALSFCDKEEAINKEFYRADAQRARIELKRKNDQAAMSYAQKALKHDPNDSYYLESLAMADFYTGKKAESMELLEKIKKIDGADTTVSSRLSAILSGRENFR